MLENFFKPVVNIPLIRLGSKKDGGYFVPKRILKKSKKVISCGLGLDWSFEENLKKKNKNIEIVFYDHTINFIFWLKNVINSIYYFVRYQSDIKKIFKFLDYKYFFKQPKITHKKLKISAKNNIEKNEISLNKILQKEASNLILKIDIEGDEYLVLRQIIKYQKKINCLIIEFHNINENKKIIKKFIERIHHLKNCNISPNNSVGTDSRGNPLVVEIIFINKKFLLKKDFKRKINLKYLSNNPYKKRIELNFNKIK